MGFVGASGQMRRYLSGLFVATLGLCAAGWLALAPVAFGYRSAGRPGPSLPSAGLHRAAWADWATAAGLAVVSLVTLACWIVACSGVCTVELPGAKSTLKLDATGCCGGGGGAAGGGD